MTNTKALCFSTLRLSTLRLSTLRHPAFIGCLLALFTSVAPLREAEGQSVGTNSKQTVKQAVKQTVRRNPKFNSYPSYFESNQSGLKGNTSYLAFTNRAAFDKTFGAAAVMGSNKFLLENAFDAGIVVAVIKRGPLIWNYTVQKVVANNRSVTVHYNAKSTATEIGAENAGASNASFASPLIVALDRKDYASVLFVENNKNVGQVNLEKPQIGKPQIGKPQLPKPQLPKPQKIKAIPQKMKAAAPKAATLPKTAVIPQKMKVAPPVRALNTSVPGSEGNRFFEGTYRVGATSCMVSPVKMAFEVKWTGRNLAQLFFFDSLASEKTGKPTYRAEESSGNARFVFDDKRFETGKFVRADGKILPIRKTSKPRAATRQVFVYLVVVGDNGKSGRKFGCDDSLVAVRRSVSTLESPLKSALQELVSLPPQYPGNAKLENFWKGRNLEIRAVSVRGGVARIQVAGEVFVAGICDEPRIITQIEATARQFPSVKKVVVYLGGKPLRRAIR